MQDSACRREVQVNLEDGLHLRPYSQISECARRFAADVRLSHGELTADAKSVLELMSLKAERGGVLVVEASGADAADAVAVIAKLFESNFEEQTAASDP